MSWAIWITGLPGSGKSVLASEAAARLRTSGEPVTILDLDRLRLLAPAPGCRRGQELVHGAVAHVAAALVKAGVPVIVDATAHRRAWRDRAREMIPRFAEVQLHCPLDVCRAREAARTGSGAPLGIHERAGQPNGWAADPALSYEPALAPELVLDTAALDPAQAADEIVGLARRLGAGSWVRSATAGPGCVIWITGRPGSGKTTLARGVSDALGAAGVEPWVLELSALRSALLQGRLPTEADEEIVHRTLACMAKLLSEAGVAVIVDATTPRRFWRELARRAIPCFAEVQLVCPADVCAERERAMRWHLGTFPAPSGATAGRPASAAPDICVEYEESPAPELTLHTHVQGHWTAVEQTVRLARQLLSRQTAGHPSEERRRPCECES